MSRGEKTLQDNIISVRLTEPPNADKFISAHTSNYIDSDFEHMKDRLTAAKMLMDPYYLENKGRNNTAWYNFTSIVFDIYKPIKYSLQKLGADHVSNAWLKYMELYMTYNVAPNSKTTAFFNAELPGASLSAFNHYMKTNKREFDWYASSLVSGDGSLSDMYGLWSHNKDKWLMNASNNGDATVVANILDFAKRIGPGSPVGGVDLYSHDAGIDVTFGDIKNVNGFNQQEALNAKLHLGCALAGLLTLRAGGTFIAKQYTCFEPFTWNLIIIYASLFDRFYLCKPLTSRQSNSEIYLIGEGYRGISDKLRDILLGRLADFNMSPFIPADMLVMLREPITDIKYFARNVFLQTATTIRENIYLFEKYRNNLKLLKSRIGPIYAKKISAWMQKYPVKRLGPNDKLPSN